MIDAQPYTIQERIAPSVVGRIFLERAYKQQKNDFGM